VKAKVLEIEIYDTNIRLGLGIGQWLSQEFVTLARLPAQGWVASDTAYVIGFALEASYPLLVIIRIDPLDLSCSGL
jgi:hypothetical protein